MIEASSSLLSLSERVSDSSQWVSLLSLQNFRCYETLRLEVDSRPVVLTGENGAGKTNILEALSFLSSGKGLRRAKLSHVTNLNSSQRGWSVFSKVFVDGHPEEIGTGTLDEQGDDRRLIKLNQTVISQADLLEKINIFWITPQIHQLLTESMSTRRRFFDKLVTSFFPAHGAHLYRYEYALRERSRLLKEGGADAQWLSILEQKMAQESMAISSLRQLFLSEIMPLVNLSPSEFPRVHVSLEGCVESLCLEMSALEAEEKIEILLKKARSEDARQGGESDRGPSNADPIFPCRRKKIC